MPTIRTPAGVVRSETDALIPGRYNRTNLIRWKDGLMQPVGGWDRVTPEPLGSVPRNGLMWLDNKFKKWTAVICDGKVLVEINSVWTDITPIDFLDATGASTSRGYGSGNYGTKDYGDDDENRNDEDDILSDRAEAVFPLRFTLDNWGEDLIFISAADGRVFKWSPSTPLDDAVVVTDAPLLAQCALVTSERHLMVFGGGGLPNRVEWSDAEDLESWNYSDPTGEAGFYDLEGGGAIISAVEIPGGYLIFTTTSVWLGRYIGAPYFYSFARIAWGMVPVSAHAIAVMGAKAVWMGTRSFYKYEAGVVTPLVCTLGLEPFNKMQTVYAPQRVTAGYNGSYQEAWFFWPSKDQSAALPENTNYCVVNLDEEWWADGVMARSFFTDNNVIGYPLAGDPSGDIYYHERGFKANGAARTGQVWAEVTGLSFDDAEFNYSVTQAEIDPGSSGPEAVQYTFKGRVNRGGTEYNFGTKIPRADGYLDVRFTAKDFSMRIENRLDVPFSLGAIKLNAIKRGKR